MPVNEAPTLEQQTRLLHHLDANPAITEILRRTAQLVLPNWYLGAGCIPHTVWNALHGFAPTAHIRDYDLTYFDASDLSYEAEDERIRAAARLFGDLGVTVEVRNQARVHLWYQQHFGYAIEPYRSVEEAIATWPTTATAVGVRSESGQLRIHAPFGLDDVFNCVARPNCAQVTREIYEAKVSRWKRCWPQLTVIAWS